MTGQQDGISEDCEIITKYNSMPDLKSNKTDQDTKDTLRSALIGLGLVVVFGLVLIMIGQPMEKEINEQKNLLIQNIQTLEDCDRLSLIDAILSKRPMQDVVRVATNDRIKELKCT